MATDRSDLLGSSLAVGMGVLFAGVVIFGRLLHGEPPFTLLFLRFGLTAILLSLLALATGRPVLPAPGERLVSRWSGCSAMAPSRALLRRAEPRQRRDGDAAVLPVPVWVMVAASLLDRRDRAHAGCRS